MEQATLAKLRIFRKQLIFQVLWLCLHEKNVQRNSCDPIRPGMRL